MAWGMLLVTVAVLAAAPGQQDEVRAEFHVESHAVSGGAELLTVFGRIPDSQTGVTADVPLLSVLRDTLGDDDPANDRLRYLWVLTSASPTLLQRAAAALPFFYFRPNLGKNADHRPTPAFDLGAASKGVWTAMAGTVTQLVVFDSDGAIVRSATRSYRTNLENARLGQLSEGVVEVELLADQTKVHPEPAMPLLSESDLLEIQTRLTLAGKTLGGLVDSEHLPEAYIKQRTRSEEMRGHNWELLRQRAEANGLYFTPLGLGRSATHALVWVARQDVADGLKHPFDGHFLSIADPFTDARLKNWTGYVMHDPQRGDLIPLALYGLEYPKVPLRLVDYRNPHAPKRREMLSRAADDTVTGVLGISKFANWPWFAGASVVTFVRTRHGDASNRTARLQSYSGVRELLALDATLDAGLRTDVLKRLEVMGVNPLETSVFKQSGIAQRQYAALLKFADDPAGLPARIRHDRNTELTAARHGIAARAGLTLAHVATLGIYSHRDAPPETLAAAVAEERRQKIAIRTAREDAAQDKAVPAADPSPNRDTNAGASQ
jgi:hypothetical protein